MNFLRHNIVTLALVVIVAAVTGLNSFTLKAGLADFHMNNSDLIAQVALSAANRCDRMEETLNRLYGDYVNLRRETSSIVQELEAATQHIRECHMLLERAGIKPPEACPKIQPDKDA